MELKLNHTIVWTDDRDATAAWWREVFGVDSIEVGPFLQIKCANEIDIDIASMEHNPDQDRPAPQHYAFHVSEEDFDDVFARLKEKGVPYRAGPDRSGEGETYSMNGGRGVYFDDPNGHHLEILTVP
ncbi:VOC family protein [Salininema proteolyticum]|uniref:VOC family protein n=1 Tax=Salininema proteolyticum TaxID=1607685 RepID=A0ABV8TWL6_9ACTN